MRLKNNFLTQKINNQTILVPTGKLAEDFRGVLSVNGTTAFIIDCLKDEIDIDGLIDKIKEVYDVDDDKAKTSVLKVIDKLKEIGAIEW